MKEGVASQTALMVAAYRARASRRPDPVCRDPWANALAGALGFERSIEFDRHFPHMELWTGLRTAYLDLHVVGAIERGVRQVVILGAGFDTRAARLAAADVQFFELDHPDTQAEKKKLLATIDGYPAEAARFAPCNFEAGDDLVGVLSAAGFDCDLPAIVVWEGVTPYLSEEAVIATASRLASSMHPQTLLVFDYVGKRWAAGEQLREVDAGARDAVSNMGEPVRWGINDPLPLLFACGYRYVRTVAFDQIAASVTETYERDRGFRFQSVCMCSREPVALPAGA